MNFKTRVTKSVIRLHEQCCERISINASIFAYSKRNRDSLAALLKLTLHSASTQLQSKPLIHHKVNSYNMFNACQWSRWVHQPTFSSFI